MAIEIVEFPIKNGDFPYFFVCLPEGKQHLHPNWSQALNSKPPRWP